jgi:hypothetical protein
VSNNLFAAIRLATAGISVFPANPASKKPFVKQASATKLEAGVRNFWTMYRATALPAINLADCGLVVVDLDRGHGNGADGVASLDALLDQNSELPPCPCVRTPRGGVHLYFRQPRGRDPLGNSASRIGPGIDTRGWHGYVIGPGTVMADGTFYESIAGTPDLCEMFRARTIPELPAWLIDLVERRPEVSARGPSSDPCDDMRGRKWALGALEGEAAELAGAGVGTRNNRLNAVVHRLATMAARGWLLEDEILTATWRACETNGYLGSKDSSDGQASFRATFESAFQSGLGKPAQDPRERLAPVQTIALRRK